MPRKFFKRYAPSPRQIKEHKFLQVFGSFLLEPNLWFFNRRSVSGAVAIGLFWTFMPIPLQMIAVAICAILLRVNLPISVALVWISNPITMPPIFYLAYQVGSWILQTPPVHDFALTIEWIGQSMSIIWMPLLVGSVVCGLLFGGAGYVAVQFYWRRRMAMYLKRRAKRETPSTDTTDDDLVDSRSAKSMKHQPPK